MSAAGQSIPSPGVGVAAPVSSFRSSKLSQRHSEVPQAESLRDKTMGSANGTTNRKVVGRKNNNIYADGKNARRDWLAAEIARMPVAEVVAITGMTETAVQNIRRGKNNISHDNLCAILEARPDFRARFFCSVGGELLCRPDQYIAFERAVNAIHRGED